MPDFGIKTSSVTAGIDQRWLHRPADKSADTISVTIDVASLKEAKGHLVPVGGSRVIPSGLALAKGTGGKYKAWETSDPAETLEGFLYYSEVVTAGDTSVVSAALVRGVINAGFLPGTEKAGLPAAPGAGHFRFTEGAGA